MLRYSIIMIICERLYSRTTLEQICRNGSDIRVAAALGSHTVIRFLYSFLELLASLYGIHKAFKTIFELKTAITTG